MLRQLKIAKWRANKQLKQQQQHLQPLKTRIYKHTQAIWFNLSTAQKLYLLALICFVFFQGGWLCASITLVALVVEFWPKFNQLWNSLAGKALILIFYASIANFVLADASGIVNNVTHVSATHLNYTHNFATLLYLPPWVLGISLTTLLLFQLILPLYIFVLLLIKPFGSERVKFISQSYSPLLTAIVRFFLAMVVIINLISFLDGKDTTEVIDDIVNSFANAENLPVEEAEQVLVEEALNEPLPKPKSNEQIDSQPPALTLKVSPENNNPNARSLQSFLNTKGYFERSKRLIAMFAYTYEADQYSRCEKSTNSKAVELNDYEIIEITQDSTMPYGYKFTVRACQSPGIKAP